MERIEHPDWKLTMSIFRRRAVGACFLVSAVGALIWGIAGNPGKATATAVNSPYINSAYADRPGEPTHFSPNYVFGRLTSNPLNNYIRDITWSSWGSQVAIGAGSVSLLDGTTSTSPVTVTLGGLRRCAGVSVYTTYSLALADGATQPKHWPRGRTGTFPCTISIANPTGNYQGKARRDGGCGFMGLDIDSLNRGGSIESGGPPEWHPRLPLWGRNLETVFCFLRWKHWGSRVTTATGIREVLSIPHTHKPHWPVSLKLSHPIWCPAAGQETPYVGAITYGALRLTLYGKPRPFKGFGNLRRDAGKQIGKRHVYTQRLKQDPSECFLGYSAAAPTGISGEP